MTKTVKIYKVEFIQYTNCMHDTVWNEELNEYIDVGKEPFLIREDEIDKYRGYGKGIKTMVFVGNLVIE